jgi:hypothetical protein
MRLGCRIGIDGGPVPLDLAMLAAVVCGMQMSAAISSSICCAWSRRLSRVSKLPGTSVCAKDSHDCRMLSVLCVMKSASRSGAFALDTFLDTTISQDPGEAILQV